jgi:dethiobiotin synthetase
LDFPAQFVIVEGAGGWFVPLNETETMADFCVTLGFPVIIVVGMRLGCLNHALLTVQAVRAAGLSVAGWVANCAEPEMAAFEDNLQSLRDLLSAPLLGVIPYLGTSVTAARAAECLQLDLLAKVEL